MYEHIWEGKIGAAGAAFSAYDIQQCIREDDAKCHAPFIVGIDPAFSDDGDFTAMVLSDQHANLLDVERFRIGDPQRRFDRIHAILRKWDETRQEVVIDNSLGHADELCNYLQAQRYHINRFEYAGRRTQMFEKIGRRLANKQITWRAGAGEHWEFGDFTEELLGIVRDNSGIVDHTSGRHDDMVCAAAQCIFVLEDSVRTIRPAARTRRR